MTPNCGAIVSALLAREDEIFAMRIPLSNGGRGALKTLKTLALRQAIPGSTKADFLRLAGRMTIMADGRSALGRCELNRAFHLVLFAPGYLPHRLDPVRALHLTMLRYVMIYLTGTGHHAHAKTQQQHRVIIWVRQCGYVAATHQLAKQLNQAAARLTMLFTK